MGRGYEFGEVRGWELNSMGIYVSCGLGLGPKWTEDRHLSHRQPGGQVPRLRLPSDQSLSDSHLQPFIPLALVLAFAETLQTLYDPPLCILSENPRVDHLLPSRAQCDEQDAEVGFDLVR